MQLGPSGLAAGAAPIQPSNGAVHVPTRLQRRERRNVTMLSGRRGRPPKEPSEVEEDTPVRARRKNAAVPKKTSTTPRKRGPKPTTSGDALQLLDPDVVEELKATAAAEEAERRAQPMDEEANPARFNFHRVLLNAASRGLPEEAEQLISEMNESGLPPGPRAYHALMFSYVRCKQPYEALQVAERAVNKGLSLLPETFVVLIFSLINHLDEPDVNVAQQVLDSMEKQADLEETQTKPPMAQAGWLMLCKELFRKGGDYIGAAMSNVKRGYDERGYVSDPELAEFVILHLARAGLKDRAYEELDALEAVGYRPGPSHYNSLIKAEAASGCWRRARYLILDAFQKPNWMPPAPSSMTALLEGMVLSVDQATGLPTGPGVYEDAPNRLNDVEKYTPSEPIPESTDGVVSSPETARALGEQFSKVREELLLYGLRPEAEAYAAMCSGYIKMRAPDEALGSFQGMCDAGGTTRMLSKKKLSALLVMLAEDDRPADLLNVLKFLVQFNQPLPRSAMNPLHDSSSGATLTTAWLPSHFEHMRTHPDDGTGKAAGGSALESIRDMLEHATETEEYDGVLLSVLGGCAVDGDGSGVWVKTNKMTLAQLKAELSHGDVYDEDDEEEGVPPLKRKQLIELVKQRREGLPKAIKDVQAHLEASRKAEAEALEAKTGRNLLEEAAKGKKKGKVELKQFRVFQMVDGRLAKVQNIVQEVPKKKIGFTVERGGRDPYADEALGMEGGGDGLEDDDELADILKEGVDEGVGDIVRDEDTVFGEAGEGMPGSEAAMRDDINNIDITIDHIEARKLNRTAGMRVAFEVLQCVEMLGGSPSGPDYEALVAGVVAERNADVALELSERLHKLLPLGYSREAVTSLFEQLARVCLNMLRVGSADLVLERAEDCDLTLDLTLYAMLTKALAGRPRHRDIAQEEMEGLVGDNVTADLLINEDEDEDQEITSGRSTLVADDDDMDDMDEDDEGVYGRVMVVKPETEQGEGEAQQQLQQKGWEATSKRPGEVPVAPVPLAVQLLSRLSTGILPADELDQLANLGSVLLGTSTPIGYPIDIDSEEEPGEGAEGERELEIRDDGSVVLATGHVVTKEQLSRLDEAVADGQGEMEALVSAGLLDKDDYDRLKMLLYGPGAVEEEGEGGEEGGELNDKYLQRLDEQSKVVVQDIEDLLLSPEVVETMSEVQSVIAELQQQAEEAEAAGDDEGVRLAEAQVQHLVKEFRQSMQPRMNEFLARGWSDDRLDGLLASVQAQLDDGDSYSKAAREFYIEQLQAGGYTVTDEDLAIYDSSPTLTQLWNDPERPMEKFFEELAQYEDTESLMKALRGDDENQSMEYLHVLPDEDEDVKQGGEGGAAIATQAPPSPGATTTRRGRKSSKTPTE